MKERTNSWVATIPTLTAVEDCMIIDSIKASVASINASHKAREKYSDVKLPRYRVSIRARGPVDGYKYGWGGYLKLAGGSRFDIYIHERSR